MLLSSNNYFTRFISNYSIVVTMKSALVGLVVISFCCGLLTAHLYDTQTQFPSATGVAPDRASPQDWISQDQIQVLSDRVILDIPNAKWATFAPTRSMDPVLDEGAYGIQIVPQSPEQLEVGDIITYDYNGRKIIHRIVQKGVDGQGYYFITKGDNNPQPDPEIVRWEQVERVLVAVVY